MDAREDFLRRTKRVEGPGAGKSHDAQNLQGADSATRRRVVKLLALAAFSGSLVSIGVAHYREAVHEWALSDAADPGGRVQVLFVLASAMLSLPLLAFAVYLWRLGARVQFAKRFPPPGYRVIRDTPVLVGKAAVTRARSLKLLALCLMVAAALLLVALRRLAWILR